MSIWLTSDCHFNHQNIVKFEPISRPYTVEEMNEVIINNWNSVVKPEDTIYVLGDFFMGQLTGIEPILSRLNGKIILIRGNHDTKNRLEFYKQKGIEIKDIAYLEYKGMFYILCHFPIADEEFKKMIINSSDQVAILYGHIHSNAPKGWYNRTFHVGVDTNDLTPVNLETIHKELLNIEN